MYDYIKQGDCLELMKEIPDKSVDFILCDLPYGTTQNNWDCEIPLDLLWAQYKRIIKDNGAIALFAQCPFDKVLGASNLKMLKYEWIIEKTRATGHLNANIAPMKAHENVLIFSNGTPPYNPQKTTGHKPINAYTKHKSDKGVYGETKLNIKGGGNTTRYPRDVIKFKWDTRKSSLHTAQKPIALLEYLIRTYTKEGDIVFDSCMGSGSTCVAAINTDRHYIGYEINEEFFEMAGNRIQEAIKDNSIRQLSLTDNLQEKSK